MTQRSGIATVLFALLSLPAAASAQSAPVPSTPAQSASSPVAARETPQDLVAKLNPQQTGQFEQAGKSFSARNYADALAAYKHLLADFPADPVLSKFAAEAALNSGDPGFALNTVKPIAQADPGDWQAAALLTRSCAESGDTSCRDSGIAHMLDLHSQGITPPGLRQYIVERTKAGDNTLLIWTSLEPWGQYKIYAMGQVINPDGKLFLRATLESNDADQALFAKEHPDLAAKGLRRFSLDGYRDTGTNSNGQRTQSHGTFKFFEGQPSYATIREEFLKIATGAAAPISTRDNLVVP
jgi:tetratricopeptide repeat protein